VEHVLLVGARKEREASLSTGFAQHTVVGSIDPTASEALRMKRLPVDIEPEYPKLDRLMAAVATGWRDKGKTFIAGVPKGS
jgi:hypothetical protein